MTELPEGLQEVVLDNARRQLAESLQSAGHAEIDKLSPTERRRRLVEEVSRLLPELLDDLAESDHDSERLEIDLINQLLSGLRQENRDWVNWEDPLAGPHRQPGRRLPGRN